MEIRIATALLLTTSENHLALGEDGERIFAEARDYFTIPLDHSSLLEGTIKNFVRNRSRGYCICIKSFPTTDYYSRSYPLWDGCGCDRYCDLHRMCS